MKSQSLYYCDHAATTPIDLVVQDEIQRVSTVQFSNPSSIHSSGVSAKAELEIARKKISKYCASSNANVIFTSGGTEANNLAILGLARANRKNGNHIIISNIEHPSVSATCEHLKMENFKITVLPVDKNGVLPLATLEKAIEHETILITVMAVNNELGTVQPLAPIAEIAQKYGVLFHSDAVQAFGKITCNFQNIGLDAISLSSHKIYGPKGVGALILKKGINIQPLVFGGKQEFLFRTGTENMPNIVGFAKAAELMFEHFDNENARLTKINNRFFNRLSKFGAKRTVQLDVTYPGIINLLFPNHNAETLLQKLDIAKVEASGGSACSSGTTKISPIVQALGFDDGIAQSAIRFSFGRTNRTKDIDKIAKIVRNALD